MTLELHRSSTRVRARSQAGLLLGALLLAAAVGLTARSGLAQTNPAGAEEAAPGAFEADPAGPQGPLPANAEGESPASTKAPSKYLIPTDPIDLFLAGGLLMWPILLASIIALCFVLERLIILRKQRVIPRAFVDRFIQHLEQGKLEPETAEELCEQNGSPVAHVFAHGIHKWGKPSVEVEQAIIDGGERQVGNLRSHLRIINGVATVAPLLGLLGTVVGMIMCFNEIAQGTGAGKAERLAGGIGVALLTTAAGLCAAIPALIMYMYLAGRVDVLVMEMDALAQRVVNLISAEGLTARPKAPKSAAATATPPVMSAKPKLPVGSK